MFLSLAIMCVIQVLMVIGFANYTPWNTLAASNSPHTLYASNMLGTVGHYWMIPVAIFAAVSTQNAIIGCVSEVCCGMAKIGLLPAIFQKKNKHGAPYVVILMMGGFTILIEATGISSNNAVQFLILTSSLFWMLTYVVDHIDVMIMRHKMKNVPRSFRNPLYPLFQIFGIVGTIYMMIHISTDPQEKFRIYMLFLASTVLLIIYAFFWTRSRLKIPLLKGVGVRKVMAMENPMYYYVRKREKKEMQKK